MKERAVHVEVNGTPQEREVKPARLLVHFLREDLGLTGTHIGCDTGNCGACTVEVDGKIVKSCLMLAVQADGSKVTTVEGLTSDELTPLQAAFREMHAVQCGYCTPGLLMNARSLLAENPAPTEKEIRHAVKGNICRCTGYVNIVRAIEKASRNAREGGVRA